MKAELLENQQTHNVRDFSRQIWLAGLGAFAKAQQEGSQWFEALVEEGQALDHRMKPMTVKNIEPMVRGIEVIKDKVLEIRDRATGVWNKLEEVFQMRVARALHRLGAPTQDDIQQLFQQMDLLSQNIQELTRVMEAEAKTRRVLAMGALKSTAVAGIANPVA